MNWRGLPWWHYG